jgi:hypothetical protein
MAGRKDKKHGRRPGSDDILPLGDYRAQQEARKDREPITRGVMMAVVDLAAQQHAANRVEDGATQMIFPTDQDYATTARLGKAFNKLRESDPLLPEFRIYQADETTPDVLRSRGFSEDIVRMPIESVIMIQFRDADQVTNSLARLRRAVMAQKDGVDLAP